MSTSNEKPIRPLIQELYRIAARLEELYPGRHFSLTCMFLQE